MLDTLLIAGNETAKKFEFAIAADYSTGVGAAMDYLTPLFSVCGHAMHGVTPGWLFHLNCKNTVLTNLTPVVDQDSHVTGVVLRIQETEGRAGNLKISCPRKIGQARRTNLLGKHLFDLKFGDDVVESAFLAYQFFQIEITFASKSLHGERTKI